MRFILNKYNLTRSTIAETTAFDQSIASRALAEYLAALPPHTQPNGNEPQIIGTWTLLNDYLSDPANTNETLHRIMFKQLQNIALDRDVFLRYQTGHASNAAMHRFNIFAEGLGEAAMDGTRFAACFPRGVTRTVIGGATSVLCSPFRLWQSAGAALTRKPLAIVQQEALYQQLRLLDITYTQAQKETIMTLIIQRYQTHRNDKAAIHTIGWIIGMKVQSSNSNNLFELLKDDSDPVHTPQLKWQFLVDYMNARNGDCLQNNGTTLFKIIADIITNPPPAVAETVGLAYTN